MRATRLRWEGEDGPRTQEGVSVLAGQANIASLVGAVLERGAARVWVEPGGDWVKDAPLDDRMDVEQVRVTAERALLEIRGVVLGNGPKGNRASLSAINEIVGFVVYGDFTSSEWVEGLTSLAQPKPEGAEAIDQSSSP